MTKEQAAWEAHLERQSAEKQKALADAMLEAAAPEFLAKCWALVDAWNVEHEKEADYGDGGPWAFGLCAAELQALLPPLVADLSPREQA